MKRFVQKLLVNMGILSHCCKARIWRFGDMKYCSKCSQRIF